MKDLIDLGLTEHHHNSVEKFILQLEQLYYKKKILTYTSVIIERIILVFDELSDMKLTQSSVVGILNARIQDETRK